jgi:hypothetical protein
MSYSIIPPFPVFNDLDGKPLENGFIYIGTANLNPETAPINVFWDSALTVPAAQPVRTVGGFLSRNGSPANIYMAEETYSITVRNVKKVFVYSDANQSNVPTFSLPGDNVSFLQAGTGAVTRTMQNKVRESVSVKDFGAIGDGTTDDTVAFNATAALGRLSFIPKTTLGYHFASSLTPKGASWLPDPAMDWIALTDSGKFSILKGTRPDQPDGANIWRFADRVFIGDAADKLTGNDTLLDNDASKSWFGNAINYAGYLGRNGKLVISSSPNYPAIIGKDIPYGIAVGMRGSDTDQEVIGVGSHVVPTGSNGWGFIAELQREGDVQCIGIEIAAKNKGSYDTTQTTVSQTVGVFGLWLQGGGDSAFGGSPTFPSTAGVVFVKGASTWNSGIVFLKDSLTNGRAMSLSSEGVGGNHYIEWQNATGNSIFTITSTKTTATNPLQIQCNNNGIDFYQSGNSILSIAGPSSNVNGLGVYGATTGVTPQIFAQGSDSNIDILLMPKGTGRVGFGTFVGTGDVACSGYIEVKAADGSIKKLMVTA